MKSTQPKPWEILEQDKEKVDPIFVRLVLKRSTKEELGPDIGFPRT